MNKKTLLDRLNNKNKFLNNLKLIILYQYYYSSHACFNHFFKKIADF